MKFFIDTANLNEIREAQSLGILDGVTTNPTLMSKEGVTGKKNIMAHYEQICKIVDGDVNAEVIATDFDGMIREGEEYAKIDDKIIVKVPMIKEAIKAIKQPARL
jgi:transaldolase